MLSHVQEFVLYPNQSGDVFQKEVRVGKQLLNKDSVVVVQGRSFSWTISLHLIFSIHVFIFFFNFILFLNFT